MTSTGSGSPNTRNNRTALLPKHAHQRVSPEDGNLAPGSALIRRRSERMLIALTKLCHVAPVRWGSVLSNEISAMNVHNIDGLMRALELEGTARIDIIRIGKDIQTAGYARRSPSVQQYEELRRAVVQWQRIADDIGRIVGSG